MSGGWLNLSFTAVSFLIVFHFLSYFRYKLFLFFSNFPTISKSSFLLTGFTEFTEIQLVYQLCNIHTTVYLKTIVHCYTGILWKQYEKLYKKKTIEIELQTITQAANANANRNKSNCFTIPVYICAVYFYSRWFNSIAFITLAGVVVLEGTSWWRAKLTNLFITIQNQVCRKLIVCCLDNLMHFTWMEIDQFCVVLKCKAWSWKKYWILGCLTLKILGSFEIDQFQFTNTRNFQSQFK